MNLPTIETVGSVALSVPPGFVRRNFVMVTSAASMNACRSGAAPKFAFVIVSGDNATDFDVITYNSKRADIALTTKHKPENVRPISFARQTLSRWHAEQLAGGLPLVTYASGLAVRDAESTVAAALAVYDTAVANGGMYLLYDPSLRRPRRHCEIDTPQVRHEFEQKIIRPGVRFMLNPRAPSGKDPEPGKVVL